MHYIHFNLHRQLVQVYDAEGRRALKYASERAAGSSQSVVELCDPVYYVSPLVTLTRTGYSKHYFEGGHRICTVIGGGFALVNWDSITSDPMPLVGPERDPLDKVLGSGAESTFDDCIEVRAELGYTDGIYKMMQNESERYETHEPAFYYHTDHLGSTSRFTDDSGKVVQTLAYMPYGEDWVDDSKFIYSDTNHIGIYQFNGKERDFESGFYYYGARYHWPELWTGWTSPDPLMDKYPGISPYNYCNWSPVIFIDPDGMETDDYFTKNGKYLGSDDAKTHNVRIIDENIWNSLEKDDLGQVDHDDANLMSHIFSQSSNIMSTDAQLNVYQYYNETGANLYAMPNETKNSRKGGMATMVGFKNNQTNVYIRVKLLGNINLKICDNADEIISCFVHEKDHINKAKIMGYHKYSQYQKTNLYNLENSAVNSQKQHPSWGGTRELFKEWVNNYLLSIKK